MNKTKTLALALTLTLSLSAVAAMPALAIATDTPATGSGPQINLLGDTALVNGYTGTITVNGIKLDLSAVPDVAGVPMRALVEADYGNAGWYPEDNMTFFYVGDTRISIANDTGAVTLDGTLTEHVSVRKQGVTFLPTAFVKTFAGFTVTEDGKNLTILTENSEPMMKLARQITTEIAPAASMKMKADEAADYGFEKETFEELIAFFPMIVNADSVVVGKVNPGKMDDAKKQLEARRTQIEAGFEHYLPGPYELAKNGKIVTDGDYIFLIISEKNDEAIQAFKDFVKAQK